MLSNSHHILVVQPLVGIGDMVWHKPWIDSLITRHKVTLATKPTVQAPILFYGAGPEFNLLNIERSYVASAVAMTGLSVFSGWSAISGQAGQIPHLSCIIHHAMRWPPVWQA